MIAIDRTTTSRIEPQATMHAQRNEHRNAAARALILRERAEVKPGHDAGLPHRTPHLHEHPHRAMKPDDEVGILAFARWTDPRDGDTVYRLCRVVGRSRNDQFRSLFYFDDRSTDRTRSIGGLVVPYLV